MTKSLTFSPNLDGFSSFHRSNAAVSSQNTRRWLFFRFEDNEWKLFHLHPKKTDGISLPADGVIFAFFGADSLFAVHCFGCFFRLRCEMMDPWFIHGYESTHQFRFITAKQHKTFDWNILTTLFWFNFTITYFHSTVIWWIFCTISGVAWNLIWLTTAMFCLNFTTQYFIVVNEVADSCRAESSSALIFVGLRALKWKYCII